MVKLPFKLDFLLSMLDSGVVSPENFLKFLKYRGEYYLESGGLSQISENTNLGLSRSLATLLHPEQVFLSFQKTGLAFSVEEIEAFAKRFLSVRQQCADRVEYLNLETNFQHRAATVRKS